MRGVREEIGNNSTNSFRVLAVKKTKLAILLGLILLSVNQSAYAACVINVSNLTQPSIGMQTAGNGDCLVNQGSISITNVYNGNGQYQDMLDGMLISHNNNTASNYGTIISTGAGISNIGSSSNAVINYGVITAFVGISSGYGVGHITNYGNIFPTTGGTGIEGGQAVANLGIIYSSAGGNVWGIDNNHDNSLVNNSGIIEISNGSSAVGVFLHQNNSTFTNSGKVTVRGDNSFAILISNYVIYGAYYDTTGSNFIGRNNTVNLLKGSVIVGDIHASPNVVGARLNINLGAGATYAYSVTGPWTVTDLDNRPMITGSAYAAGIGAQETASEILYQRTSAITSSLDRRLRSYAADEVDNQPYWLDVYYSDVSRNSGGNYSTQTAFSNYNYGITAGFKLPSEITPLELIVNVAQSNLNIDSGNQKIDSTSLMAGVLAPNLADVLGAKLSAKAMAGYADHDGDRKVMTNSLLYDGSRQIKSDYNSYYGVVGAALTRVHPITDHLNADVLVGLDLNTQRVESYKETDYFAWDGRTLTQLQSRVQAGLDYRFNENKASVFARVGAENRNLIGGAIQDYEINNTNVSFNTNNKNDTYLTEQIGVRAQLEKHISLYGVFSKLHSADSVNTVQGNIGLRADF